MPDVVTGYSRMLWYEVWNFMSIEHGKVCFDDKNIINLKGYNDSGKSSMLVALDVLMFNITPNKQVDFIQDDKDYFRIMAHFDDGVSILRDKYINGQSLYEMYKDSELIFSTKKGKALSKVSDVPEPIKQYLGLLTSDSIRINSRNCHEKYLGVQTTGSENYKMFNTVLKSEELAHASNLINIDKNKLLADLNAVEADLEATKRLVADGSKLTKELIDSMWGSDSLCDKLDTQISNINNISKISNEYTSINISPELGILDVRQISDINNIASTVKDLDSIQVFPELQRINTQPVEMLLGVSNIINAKNKVDIHPELNLINSDRLSVLNSISVLFKNLNDVEIYPEVSHINDSRFKDLVSIASAFKELDYFTEVINSLDNNIEQVSVELFDLQKEISTLGIKMIKCPNCGELIDANTGHTDKE